MRGRCREARPADASALLRDFLAPQQWTVSTKGSIPMALTRNDLCEAFKRSAASIYDLITFSYSRSTLGVSEEAITEMMLVELDRRLSPYIATIKFNKREDGATSGADWLWTIGRPGRWFSLLVQAKLARPTSQTLHGLYHGNGEQLANLVAYARKEGCFPVYAIYNNRLAASSEHECGTIKMDPKQMGSVLVRAGHVATVYRRARLETRRVCETYLPNPSLGRASLTAQKMPSSPMNWPMLWPRP